MKKYIYLIVFGFLSSFAWAQNIEFEKNNFPQDKRKDLKNIVKNLEMAYDIVNYNDSLSFMGFTHEIFKVSYDFNPNNAKLCFHLGISELMMSNDEKALMLFNKAQDLGVDSKHFNYYYSRALHKNYQFDKSIEKMRTFVAAYKEKDADYWKSKALIVIQHCNTAKEMVNHPIRVWIDNLGNAINTGYPEYSPFISTDQTTLLFIGRRHDANSDKDENGMFFENIYESKNVEGVWTAAKPVIELNNPDDHDAVAGISSDGKTMFVYQGKSQDLFYSQKGVKGWSKIKEVPGINTKDGRESAACFSYNKKQLFFISSTPKGFSDSKIEHQGSDDIYVADWDEKKEKWVNIQNMGKTLNTKGSEIGIFAHPDGRTLYFASDGHKTMGGYDLFKSEKQEDGTWGAPQNLGYPVNTTGNDVFFVVAGNGTQAYYTSASGTDSYGEKDLYLITFLGPEKEPIYNGEDNLIAVLAAPIKAAAFEPEINTNSARLAILKGVIRDEQTQKILANAEIELVDLEKNEVIGTFKSDENGKYLVTLPSGTNYGIAVKSDGYLFHSENFNIPSEQGYREYEKDVDLKKIEIGKAIVLKNIFFDTDKYDLRPESVNELERLNKLLIENPTIKIEISGHTDSRGSDSHNQVLSQNRAKSVVDYLIKKGIDTDRMVFAGYGEKNPIATNETSEGRQENRRTEFKILSM